MVVGLAVTSLSETIQNAVESSYENIKNIDFTGKKYRKILVCL